MSYCTYFEIGGHVIENQVVSRKMPGRPAPTDLKHVAKQTGVPAPLLRKAGKDVQEKTGYDVVRAAEGYGRLRRARWAATTALGIAAVDGPLPFGDAVAVGFLAAYGAYEFVAGIGDMLQ